MPLREYLCGSCGHQFESFKSGSNPEDYQTDPCPHCETPADLLPALIGGYQGNMGSGSTRPKNSMSMPSRKAYTGNKT